MRISAEGKINEKVMVLGHPIYPGYIVKGSNRTMMVEAGMNILGPLYLKQLRELADTGALSRLDSLIVTHGHYDHIGALPFLKRNIPPLEVRAPEAAISVMGSEKAVRTMNFLSRETSKYFEGMGIKIDDWDEIAIGPVEFAEPLRDGDVIDLGGWTCEVISTPGHTRDHVSFFLREPGILFPGEALGNPIMEREDLNKVEFLTSFRDYVDSIEKLLRLKPLVKVIAMSHLYCYTGEDVPRFMDMALRDANEYRSLIDSYLDRENGEVEKATATMVRVEYDEKKSVYQERNAYVANLTAQVKAVAALR